MSIGPIPEFGLPPAIPLESPTQDSLLAEAAALGDHFSEVTSHPADVIADAEEMLGARQDLADLIAREYPVSEGMLKRIELLKDLLSPHAAELVRSAAASTLKTQDADAACDRLVAIRGELGKIGDAAGIPADLFSLQSRKTQRLNVVMMRMDVVLENVAAVRAHLPDKARVDRLVVEARDLIDQQKAARRAARLMRADRGQGSLQQERLERLLMDVMMHVSKQGLAAYPNDPTREARYRLDNVYGAKKSAVGDPGAGGTGGTPR
ncbi:MAG: hypothetical protein HY904_26485 [Deltaproteobacteria bacterium]|nr:hypothetical protein [Deltaproteobacteria bacterium]